MKPHRMCLSFCVFSGGICARTGVTLIRGIRQHTAVDHRQPQVTNSNSRSEQWLHALSSVGSSQHLLLCLQAIRCFNTGMVLSAGH